MVYVLRNRSVASGDEDDLVSKSHVFYFVSLHVIDHLALIVSCYTTGRVICRYNQPYTTLRATTYHICFDRGSAALAGTTLPSLSAYNYLRQGSTPQVMEEITTVKTRFWGSPWSKLGSVVWARRLESWCRCPRQVRCRVLHHTTLVKHWIIVPFKCFRNCAIYT